MAAAKPKPHKQARFKEHVAALKNAVVAADPDSYLDERPTWRIALLEMCPPYGWHELTLGEASNIQKRLGAFETMTWREILFGGDKNQNHFMSVDALSKEAQERLGHVAPDVDEVVSLRIGKQERVFGILHGAVCQILFWDPLHAVYKMNITDN